MKPTSIASLFAGAVAGVAAMYLLDPEQGERRRQAIANKAGNYWDDASGALHGHWNSLSDHARGVGQQAYSAAQEYANNLAGQAKGAVNDAQGHAEDAHAHAVNQAQSWLDQSRKWLSGYRDQASDYANQATKHGDKLVDKASSSASDVHSTIQQYGQAAWDRARKLGLSAHDYATDAINRGRKAIAPPPPSPVVPVAITAVSFLALGAGAMYIIDPQKGRARRAWISQKVTSIVRRSGNTAYSKGRHLANRAYGVAVEARGSAGDLVERVNQAVGSVLQDPRVVKVMADANGRITLAGNVMHEQIDRVIAAVRAIPGVSDVINRLDASKSQTTDTNTESTQGVH